MNKHFILAYILMGLSIPLAFENSIAGLILFGIGVYVRLKNK